MVLIRTGWGSLWIMDNAKVAVDQKSNVVLFATVVAFVVSCRDSSGRLAREVRGVVGAAHAAVDRHLWVRAEGSRHVDAGSGNVRRLDARGRLARFTPSLEGRHPVDLVRARTATW